MDPNLVLAHMAHNAAVLQLHQSVAYPPIELQVIAAALPSASSAKTCAHAAGEISAIADEYVRRSHGVVHPLVSFCLFLAGRVLVGTFHSKPRHMIAMTDLIKHIRSAWVSLYLRSSSRYSRLSPSSRFDGLLVQPARLKTWTIWPPNSRSVCNSADSELSSRLANLPMPMAQAEL